MPEPIQAQPGFQFEALSTSADIAIIGGAAGAGKSAVLLMESMRNTGIDNYAGIIFRRTSPQIRNPGALLDNSKKFYPRIGAKLRENEMEWVFPNGTSKIKFSHLQHEKNVEDHQGAEYAFIGFDELTHFSETQFFYLLSRNRSTCGVTPYVRATCNPDPDSWVATFIEWWIDQDSGFPIPERSGVLRYFIRLSGVIVWGNSKQEVYDKAKDDEGFIKALEECEKSGAQWQELVKSVTFIPGNISANKILMKENPGYMGNLLALDTNEQAQLLHGNWKVSIDGLALNDYTAVQNVFDNYSSEAANKRYITCDVSRFGRDLTVIFTWLNWTVVKIIIMYKSESHEVIQEIERLRRDFGIVKSNVLVDQDGVGGGVVRDGKYAGFRGGAPPMRDNEANMVEGYENIKTQCCYRTAEENINTGEIRINVHSECVVVIDGSTRTYSTKIKSGGKVEDVRDRIKKELRAWKKKPRSNEGKLQMNNKDEQKIILGGLSPDFGDNIMMRKYFDLRDRFSRGVRAA